LQKKEIEAFTGNHTLSLMIGVFLATIVFVAFWLKFPKLTLNKKDNIIDPPGNNNGKSTEEAQELNKLMGQVDDFLSKKEKPLEIDKKSESDKKIW
jgi:hypothetical protein